MDMRNERRQKREEAVERMLKSKPVMIASTVVAMGGLILGQTKGQDLVDQAIADATATTQEEHDSKRFIDEEACLCWLVFDSGTPQAEHFAKAEEAKNSKCENMV